tara:strand:+ start:367 stop:891 length:525 start_codon:yes stop_codon:yes gene_type:complete
MLSIEAIKRIIGDVEVIEEYTMEIDDKTAGKNFKESLGVGKSSEDAVCAKIKKKYPRAHVIEGYCKGYDIFVPENGMKIEVKQDKKSNFTGNIVVEIEFNGKPSALSTTTADYWVFDDGEIYIWITPDILRQVVQPMKPASFIGNGDNKWKKAYLVKKDVIIKNAIKIDNTDRD